MFGLFEPIRLEQSKYNPFLGTPPNMSEGNHGGNVLRNHPTLQPPPPGHPPRFIGGICARARRMPGRARKADHTPRKRRGSNLRDAHTKETGAERGWWEGAKETSPLLPTLHPLPASHRRGKRGGEGEGRERNPE